MCWEPFEKKGKELCWEPFGKKVKELCWEAFKKKGEELCWEPFEKKVGSPLEKSEAASSSRPISLWKRDGSLQAAMGLTDDKDGKKKAFVKKAILKRPAALQVCSGKRRFWKKITMTSANKPKTRAYLQGCYEGENKKC